MSPACNLLNNAECSPTQLLTAPPNTIWLLTGAWRRPCSSRLGYKCFRNVQRCSIHLSVIVHTPRSNFIYMLHHAALFTAEHPTPRPTLALYCCAELKEYSTEWPTQFQSDIRDVTARMRSLWAPARRVGKRARYVDAADGPDLDAEIGKPCAARYCALSVV